MISGWQIYLITRCDAIQTLFIVGGISMIIPIIFGFVSLGMGTDLHDDEEKARGIRILKFCVPIAVFCALFAALTPDTKEMIAMVSLPAIANSQLAQKDIPDAIRKLWKQYAEREDMKEEKRK